MYPFTMLIKAVAEAVRASSPQGSSVNQLASGMKQGITLLDALTADTPSKRIQVLAALLSEHAYAESDSEKERLALTLGNVILLAIEGAQYMQNANQPGQQPYDRNDFSCLAPVLPTAKPVLVRRTGTPYAGKTRNTAPI